MQSLFATVATPWQEAGSFFSHSIFALLASVVISSKVQEWIVSDLPKQVDVLIKEIDEELAKLHSFSLKNDKPLGSIEELYNDCKESAEKLSKSVKKWKTVSNWVYIPLCIFCLAVDVFLICSGCDEIWGAWVLVLSLPLPLAHWITRWFYSGKETELDGLCKKFSQRRARYQSTYVTNEGFLVGVLKDFLSQGR